MEPDLSGAAELDDTHQMISLEDMELAEKMITSMQIYHVPLQLKLVSPPGEQLKLNSDNFWTLYLCLDGSIQIDDSRITVRSSSTVEKVMLPPGHYNVELVGGDDNNNFTRYPSSFDVPNGGAKLMLHFHCKERNYYGKNL